MPEASKKPFFNLDKYSDEDIRLGFSHQLGLMLMVHAQVHGGSVTSLGSVVVDLLGAESAMRMFGELVKQSNVGRREGTMPKDKPSFEISQAAIDEVRAHEEARREENYSREKRENLIIAVARQFKTDKLKINPGSVANDDDPTYQEKLHAEYVIDVVLSKIE